MINMEDQEIQSHFEHLIFYTPSMIVSNTVLVLLLDSLVSKSLVVFLGLKKTYIVAYNQNSSPNRRGTTATRTYSKNKC